MDGGFFKLVQDNIDYYTKVLSYTKHTRSRIKLEKKLNKWIRFVNSKDSKTMNSLALSYAVNYSLLYGTPSVSSNYPIKFDGLREE